MSFLRLFIKNIFLGNLQERWGFFWERDKWRTALLNTTKRESERSNSNPEGQQSSGGECQRGAPRKRSTEEEEEGVCVCVISIFKKIVKKKP